MFDFGIRIRTLRTKYKMSQEELGRRLGRSKSVISSYENNLKLPSIDILTDMALIFNVSLDYLVGIDKAEMVSINGLSDAQRDIIDSIIFLFKNSIPQKNGLNELQLETIGLLINEFCK